MGKRPRRSARHPVRSLDSARMEAESPKRQAWEGKDAAESLLQEADARVLAAATFAWTPRKWARMR
jgi:hypothetical protein